MLVLGTSAFYVCCEVGSELFQCHSQFQRENWSVTLYRLDWKGNGTKSMIVQSTNELIDFYV